MLQQSNSILRLCIVVVVVMLVQLSPVQSQDVKIGTQVWTSKNLDVSTFRNGEPILNVKNRDDWQKAGENKQPAWCYYNFNIENGTKFGKLYNWYAVNDSRGLAPKGYHIPSDAEWTVLTDFLGGIEIAGFKMKSYTGWANNGNGDNSSEFNGLSCGSIIFNGDFYDYSTAGVWWSSSGDFHAKGAWYRSIGAFDEGVFRNGNNRANGLSVRCIKD
jgi:uncharacterized protein (TIGR02145 family)